MKRALLAAALVTAACNNNTILIGSGQFIAPTGLAVVPAADRDLLFVAGTGRDGLRALEICEDFDSNGNPVSTCPEDLQFVPGPIRVFPANVETGDRPLRLAGAWLTLGADAGTADAGPAADAGTADAGSAGGGTRQGVVLVVGADKTVRLVDSKNLLDAVQSGTEAPPLTLPIDGVAADVVAENFIDPNSDIQDVSPSVNAFVATVASGTAPAELIEFPVALGADGGAALPDPSTIRKCALNGVVPSRLAIAPQETPPPPSQPSSCTTGASPCIPDPVPPPTTDLFVADGAGDGVVRVVRSSLVVVPPSADGTPAVPPPCTMTRISAGGHSVRSIALSPQWYEVVIVPGTAVAGVVDAGDADAGPPPPEQVTVSHPAGELLLMVLEPNATPQPGFPFDSGGVLFVDLCTYSPPIATGDNPHCKDFTGSAIVPIPPFRYDKFSPGAADGTAVQAMEPLSPGGLARDATFLRSIRPDIFSPFSCPTGACTPVNVAQGSTPIQGFFLLAAVTSSDGGTYFLDVFQRRFIDVNFYNLPNNSVALEPLLTVVPTLSPPAISGTPATLAFAAPDDNHPLFGWFHPGVTHTATWRAVWHGTFPGLDRRGGTVTPSNRGTMFFDGPGNFAAAQADPILQFAVGDNVGFISYSVQTNNSSAACQTLVSTESLVPLRFEAAVVAINPDGAHPGRLELAGQQAVGFNPNDACTSFGVVAEFHTGGARPWIVFDNGTAVARIAQGQAFVGHEPRFDYPFDYTNAPVSLVVDAPGFPVASTDEAVAFSLLGDEPDVPGSQFSFSLVSSLVPLLYGDSAVVSGFATSVVSYTSTFNPNALFTAVTGANSVVMATPDVLGATNAGLRVFR
jgi:hypothetical protein